MSATEQLHIVTIGATSAIVHATARQFCSEEPRFFMVGRNQALLESNAQDLKVRGAGSCDCYVADLANEQNFSAICDAAFTCLGRIDLVIVGHGVLGSQKAAEQDISVLGHLLEINFLRQAQIMGLFANRLEKQQSGCLAVITSVAGDRGRPSNYIYGSAKAGMIAYLEGLRARLAKKGVRVMDVRPGIVNTPMTEGIQSKPFVVEPSVVARVIYRAYYGKKDVVYAPLRWLFIMAVIRALPRFLFKRMSL